MNDKVPILLTNESVIPRNVAESGLANLRQLNDAYKRWDELPDDQKQQLERLKLKFEDFNCAKCHCVATCQLAFLVYDE